LEAFSQVQRRQRESAVEYEIGVPQKAHTPAYTAAGHPAAKCSHFLSKSALLPSMSWDTAFAASRQPHGVQVHEAQSKDQPADSIRALHDQALECPRVTQPSPSEQYAREPRAAADTKLDAEAALMRQIARLQIAEVSGDTTEREHAAQELRKALAGRDPARVDYFIAIDAVIASLEAKRRGPETTQPRGPEPLVEHDRVASKLEGMEMVIAQQSREVELLSAVVADALAVTGFCRSGEQPFEEWLSEITAGLRQVVMAAMEADELRARISGLVAAGDELVEARDAAKQRIADLERLVVTLEAEHDIARIEVERLRALPASALPESPRRRATTPVLSSPLASIVAELQAMLDRSVRILQVGSHSAPSQLISAEVERYRRRLRAMRSAGRRALGRAE
jgi:hypothetical protein